MTSPQDTHPLGPPGAPILVGVDGSDSSRAAIDLGIRQARRHRRPLRLVHAFVWPQLGVPVGPSPHGPPAGGLAADAERILADALARVAVADPDLAVTGEVIIGAPAAVLLRAARAAGLTVLGDRGLGGFTGLLVGSVAVQVSAHAPGPVMIARGEPAPDGPVVVGVDGSPASHLALAFALTEAASRGCDLVALTTWYGRPPRATVEELPLIYDAEDVAAGLARQLAHAVAQVRERAPAVTVRQRVRHGRPARSLVEASAEAQLISVGARGRGGFTGLLLGSVSQSVLHHAHCPVAIVRAAPGSG